MSSVRNWIGPACIASPRRLLALRPLGTLPTCLLAHESYESVRFGKFRQSAQCRNMLAEEPRVSQMRRPPRPRWHGQSQQGGNHVVAACAGKWGRVVRNRHRARSVRQVSFRFQGQLSFTRLTLRCMSRAPPTIGRPHPHRSPFHSAHSRLRFASSFGVWGSGRHVSANDKPQVVNALNGQTTAACMAEIRQNLFNFAPWAALMQSSLTYRKLALAFALTARAAASVHFFIQGPCTGPI